MLKISIIKMNNKITIIFFLYFHHNQLNIYLKLEIKI